MRVTKNVGCARFFVKHHGRDPGKFEPICVPVVREIFEICNLPKGKFLHLLPIKKIFR